MPPDCIDGRVDLRPHLRFNSSAFRGLTDPTQPLGLPWSWMGWMTCCNFLTCCNSLLTGGKHWSAAEEQRRIQEKRLRWGWTKSSEDEMKENMLRAPIQSQLWSTRYTGVFCSVYKKLNLAAKTCAWTLLRPVLKLWSSWRFHDNLTRECKNLVADVKLSSSAAFQSAPLRSNLVSQYRAEAAVLY